MRKKDLMTLIVVGAVAAVFSVIISSMVFTSPSNRQTPVEIVEPITANFTLPTDDPVLKTVFNDKAVDPTQVIIIGTNQNPNPFSGSTGH